MEQQENIQLGAVIHCAYDSEYEEKVREELTDPPPLPSITEQVAPGCYITKPKPIEQG